MLQLATPRLFLMKFSAVAFYPVLFIPLLFGPTNPPACIILYKITAHQMQPPSVVGFLVHATARVANAMAVTK